MEPACYFCDLIDKLRCRTFAEATECSSYKRFVGGSVTQESDSAVTAPVKSDGGPTSYYDLPPDSITLNDLIEHKKMSFALGNIFKACYRLGEKSGTDALYDINKIIYFAHRLRAVEEKKLRKK